MDNEIISKYIVGFVLIIIILIACIMTYYYRRVDNTDTNELYRFLKN